MAKQRATLRDVAERAGVHLSTVSRVLNLKSGYVVSDAVAEKIRQSAAELGYKTNPFALALRVNRSFTVGVVIPDLTNPVFPSIIRGIEHQLAKQGYTAILADSDNGLDEERRIVDRMRARQTDGLILATAHRADDLIKDAMEDGTPVVLINRRIESDAVSAVVPDDMLGIRQAVDHLVALGHREIAHIAGPQHTSTGYQRRAAFIACMRDHGLKADRKLIVNCKAYSEAEGKQALTKLLAGTQRFTAVVAANDLMALGCYDALKAAGLSCPDDVSITGFNDMPFADKFHPPLTTLHVPLYEMGVEAARTVLHLIEQAPGQARVIELPPRLVIRGSTAPLRAAKAVRRRRPTS